MPEYTPAIDAQISQMLRQRGAVDIDSVAGYGAEDGARFLATYVQIHAREVALTFDGRTMTWATVAAPAPTPVPAPAATTPAAPTSAPAPSLSPVDQVLAMDHGPSLLDTPAVGGKVPGWLWLLPLSLPVVGGVIAWLVAKNTNRQVAWAMFWTGVVVTVATFASVLFMGPMMSALTGGAAPGQLSGERWPASQSGKPVLYYFGTAGSPDCDEMKPVVAAIETQYQGRLEFKVYDDLSKEPDAAKFAKAQGVLPKPTIVFTDASGKELNRWLGAQAEPTITNALDAALQ